LNTELQNKDLHNEVTHNFKLTNSNCSLTAI